MIGPGPDRIASAYLGDGWASVYPSITNASIWLDRNRNVYSDTAGTAPAIIGGTVGSWRSAGGVWGTSLVTQSNATLQPTLETGGLKSDGINDYLTCSIALAGDFTIYFVATRSATSIDACLATYTGDKGFFASSDNNTLYAATDTVTWCAKTGYSGFSTTPWIIKYRCSGTTLYWKANGTAEQSQAGVAVPAVTLTRLLYATSATSNAGSRFRQMVVVNRSLTDGSADDLAIRTKLLALEPGSVDC